MKKKIYSFKNRNLSKKNFSKELLLILFSFIICKINFAQQSFVEQLRMQKEKMQRSSGISGESSEFLEAKFEERMKKQQEERRQSLLQENKKKYQSQMEEGRRGLKTVFSMSDQMQNYYSMISNPSEFNKYKVNDFVNEMRKLTYYLGGRPPDDAELKIKYIWRELTSVLRLAIQNINANKIPILEPHQKELEQFLKILESNYSVAEHFKNINAFLNMKIKILNSDAWIKLIELLITQAIELKKKDEFQGMDEIIELNIKEVVDKILQLRDVFSKQQRDKIADLFKEFEEVKYIPKVKEGAVEEKKIECVRTVSSNFISNLLKLAQKFVQAKMSGEKPVGEDTLLELLKELELNMSFINYKPKIQTWRKKLEETELEIKEKEEEVKEVKQEIKVEPVRQQPKPVQPKKDEGKITKGRFYIPPTGKTRRR
ncbi:hypothetical protein GF322_00595 [Candidatus Dependentiae bacterium]|nr:hypothetical protein [Candidatus Dependentiae bacterium]